jgi:hypothetical protein
MAARSQESRTAMGVTPVRVLRSDRHLRCMRYMELHTPHGSGTDYFDKNGAVVAARGTTDYIDEQCKGVTWYGKHMTCNKVVLKTHHCVDPQVMAGPKRKTGR